MYCHCDIIITQSPNRNRPTIHPIMPSSSTDNALILQCSNLNSNPIEVITKRDECELSNIRYKDNVASQSMFTAVFKQASAAKKKLQAAVQRKRDKIQKGKQRNKNRNKPRRSQRLKNQRNTNKSTKEEKERESESDDEDAHSDDNSVCFISMNGS